MLRHKTPTSNPFNKTRTTSVNKRCPQGTVLVPLMWTLVVNDLLWENLNVKKFTDDISIVVNNKFGTVVSERIQQALSIFVKAEKMSTNSVKTSVVAFTRSIILTWWGRNWGKCNKPRSFTTSGISTKP